MVSDVGKWKEETSISITPRLNEADVNLDEIVMWCFSDQMTI